jgi:hypothetical protein
MKLMTRGCAPGVKLHSNVVEHQVRLNKLAE